MSFEVESSEGPLKVEAGQNEKIAPAIFWPSRLNRWSIIAEKKVIFHVPCHTNASPSNFIDFMALFAGNDITSGVREKRSLVK